MLHYNGIMNLLYNIYVYLLVIQTYHNTMWHTALHRAFDFTHFHSKVVDSPTA